MHTPGPWEVRIEDGHTRIYAPDGDDSDAWAVAEIVPLCGVDGSATPHNARLIAVAPDLYEALTDAESAIASLEPDDFGGVFDGHGQQVGTVRDELLAKIRAALARVSPQAGAPE